MRGRPRKEGERYPSGDLRPIVAPQQRRLSQLEELRARNVITSRHVAAARKWAGLAARHATVIMTQSRAPKSPRYELGRAPRAGHVAGVFACCDPRTSPCHRCQHANAVKRQWSETKATLGPAFNVVYDVVLSDLACPDHLEPVLYRGLQRLADLLLGTPKEARNARFVTQRT